MRVEFVVLEHGRSWVVKRGHTSPLRYESAESAIRAARHCAQAAAAAGERGVLRVMTPGGDEQVEVFEPERTVRAPEPEPVRARRETPGKEEWRSRPWSLEKEAEPPRMG